ncbi:MAG: hypothetical protein ACFFA3_14020 [Promethearchaeota archaeon]
MDYYQIGKHSERECLVDPQGKPFFTLGIVHSKVYFELKGRTNLESKNNNKLVKKIVSDFLDWGFNSAGYHSPLEVMDYLPFMQDSYLAPISYWMGKPVYPDVFNPIYKKSIEDKLERIYKIVRHHSNLIGYYWTDTPRWDLNKARNQYNTDWVSTFRSLSASSPGKEKYVTFLYELINDHDELKIYSGIKNPKYKDLLKSDFSKLNLAHPVVKKHDSEFLRLIARQYYSIAAQVTKKLDPDHLIFGDRYLAGDHPIEVLQEALPFVDAISVQPYDVIFNPEYFNNLHSITGKPILICDHAINFPTKKFPETIWLQCPNELEAAKAYTEYLKALIECPYILGYHRCQYIDQETSTGSPLKQGFLRTNEKPYKVLLKHVRKTNLEVMKTFSERTVQKQD